MSVADRIEKRCPTCGLTKPSEAFSRERVRKPGRVSLRRECKPCCNARVRARRGCPQTPGERFFAKVNMTPGCWLWTGAGDRYGQFKPIKRSNKKKGAHVFAFESVRGPVPKGMELDHLCRNKRCVRPDHLEAVTRAENNRRIHLFMSDWHESAKVAHVRR